MLPFRNDTRRPAPVPFGLGGAVIGSATGVAGAAMVTTIGIGTAITDPLSQQLARLITIFVPPGVGESILEVAKIVYNEFSGEILLTDIKIAISLVTIMQGLSTKPVYKTRKFTPAEDRPIAVRFSHYMRYALAAYGSFLYNPLQSDADFILDTTRLPRDKVYPYVDERAVTGKAMLEHFVAIDDHEGSVVVSLKGSATLEAFLKDARLLYAEADLWGQRFHVHEGMWQAAQGLAQFPLLLSQIKEALMSNPGYKLVVLGHSLGGGVAILLACLFADPDGNGNFVTNDRTLPGRRIECYGFEPAASVDEELRQLTKSMTYSIVNKNDIVPFLSHGSLRDFGAMAKHLKGNTLYLASIADGLLKNQADPEAFMANFRAVAKNKKLVPPGRVWLIDVVDYVNLEVVEILNVGERFAEMRFILGMVHDHLLPNCRSSMDRLREVFE